MEMQGTPYLPEEEQAADAMAVTLLNEAQVSSRRTLARLLEERLRARDDPSWRRGRAHIRSPPSGSRRWMPRAPPRPRPDGQGRGTEAVDGLHQEVDGSSAMEECPATGDGG